MRTVLLKSNVRFFLILLLILVVFVRCDEDEIPFPDVYVNVTLQLDTQLGNVLVGEYVEVDGHGVGGLIIFRASQNEFLAFDRACTYETSSECSLEDEVGYYNCPCCGSQFWMISNTDLAGTLKQGPAKSSLKQYNCYYNPPNQVIVRN